MRYRIGKFQKARRGRKSLYTSLNKEGWRGGVGGRRGAGAGGLSVYQAKSSAGPAQKQTSLPSQVSHSCFSNPVSVIEGLTLIINIYMKH